MTMMKKLTTLIVVASVCLASFGRPGPHGGPAPRGPMHGPRIHHALPLPPPAPPRHHHHHSGPFWTGVGVGLAGSFLASPVIALPSSPAPVVIQAAPKRVWVPPVYGERPIYRAGIYVGVERYIITPGYWTTSY